MNILMVLSDSTFPPDIRVEKEAKSLIKEGHKLFLLARNKGNQPKIEDLENIKVIRFRQPLREIPNVKLLLVGDGPSKDKIERMAEEFSQNVIFVGLQPQEKIQNYISVADICVYFPNYNVRKYGFLGDPIKFYEYMAMEKPVVTTKIKNFALVLERENCGVLVEPDHEKFADAVVDLIKNPEKARELGINGRKAILENYNWEKSAGMLINTCGDIAEAMKKRR